MTSPDPARHWILLLTLLSVAAAGAQGTPALLRPQADGVAPAEQRWIRYDEQLSRIAFAACDRDADDRLSFLEVRRAIRNFGPETGVDGFRHLDADRDGFLSWPEFDSLYRATVERGGTLRFLPQRPLRIPEQRRARARQDVLTTMIELLDTDGSNALSREEAASLLRSLGIPDAALENFSALDLDGDGELSLPELEPLRTVAATYLESQGGRRADDAAHRSLPASFRHADLDRDDVLSDTELERLLMRIDPVLGRWSERVLRDADRSGNRTLGAAEIRAAAAR